MTILNRNVYIDSSICHLVHCVLECPIVSMFINIFFQAFAHDIQQIPKSLTDKIDLLPSLLCESKAETTVKGYYYGFMRFQKWAVSNGIERDKALSASPFQVSLYLASLVQQNCTPSPVIQAFYSIKWAHSLIGVDSPTECELVKNVFEGAKRRLSKPTIKKEPITPAILNMMYNSLFCQNSLFSQRIICACLLAYAGFL